MAGIPARRRACWPRAARRVAVASPQTRPSFADVAACDTGSSKSNAVKPAFDQSRIIEEFARRGASAAWEDRSRKARIAVERLLEKVMKADRPQVEPRADQDLGARLHDRARIRRQAFCDPRRPEVRQTLRHRGYGRAPARRVCPDPHLPRTRRQRHQRRPRFLRATFEEVNNRGTPRSTGGVDLRPTSNLFSSTLTRRRT